MASELNEIVLESALLQVGPRLLGLHIIGCVKIDHVVVLRLLNHTPLLESLSFTTYVSQTSDHDVYFTIILFV